MKPRARPREARLVADLQRRLREASDPRTKAWFENYLKHVISYRGLKTPVVARILAEWRHAHELQRLSDGDQLRLADMLIREGHAEDKFAGILYMQKHLLRLLDADTLLCTAEGLFVPLFFASAGLHLNLAFLELNPEVIAALIFVPLAAKFAGAFFSAYITRLEAPFAVASGLMAKGVAEIALLLVMLHAHVIDEALFSLLVMIMFGYILLTPLGISFALRRIRRSEDVADDSEIPHLMARFVLDEVHVRDVLDQTRIYPEQSMTVRSFIDTWTTPEQHDYVVVDDGNLTGIVSLSLLRYLPRGQWGTTKLKDVLRRRTPTAAPDELVEDTLQRMLDSSVTVFPVVDPETDEFLGSISSYEIMEMIVFTASSRDI